jgi:hypothetical protein
MVNPCPARGNDHGACQKLRHREQDGYAATMRLAWALLVVAGCQTDHPDYPINPGGGIGTGSGGGVRDANEDSGDGGPKLIGKVCIMTDLRRLDLCTTAGASGLLVTVGTKTTTTDVAGNFAIDTPAGSNLVWHVSGNAIVTSVIPFSADTTLHAIDATTYTDLLNANGVLLQAQQGSILVRVEKAGAALTGAKASVTPVSPNATFYDAASATIWNQNATGARGMAWLPGTDIGTLTLRMTPPVGSAIAIGELVEDQALTFVTIDAP